ncbi:hypothetical protein P389DRAFT_165450 [Cystobasidium minutum MCA 4210]|uniref:uncharacterized protein n=1 Tax=Cystobasidium minutum MCA 4210 TaxID=1397322 RepID=UPI0034CF49D1|eukprot:jgi/Rhomi1/165450/fgenesh1_kg.1_\
MTYQRGPSVPRRYRAPDPAVPPTVNCSLSRSTRRDTARAKPPLLEGALRLERQMVGETLVEAQKAPESERDPKWENELGNSARDTYRHRYAFNKKRGIWKRFLPVCQEKWEGQASSSHVCTEECARKRINQWWIPEHRRAKGTERVDGEGIPVLGMTDPVRPPL